jgi:hypothetical protein
MRRAVKAWAAVCVGIGVFLVPVYAATEADWTVKLQKAYDSSVVEPAAERPTPAYDVDQYVPDVPADPIYQRLERMLTNIVSKLNAKQLKKFTDLDGQMEYSETERRLRYYSNVCTVFKIDPC